MTRMMTFPAPWDLIKRGCRHLFRLRWEINNVTRRIRCPCCGGSGGHVASEPTTRVKELHERGIYSAANWVDCTLCVVGVVYVSQYHTYENVVPGQCVTGRQVDHG